MEHTIPSICIPVDLGRFSLLTTLLYTPEDTHLLDNISSWSEEKVLYSFKNGSKIKLGDVIKGKEEDLEKILRKVRGAIGGKARWKKYDEVKKLKELYSSLKQIYISKTIGMLNGLLKIYELTEVKVEETIEDTVREIYLKYNHRRKGYRTRLYLVKLGDHYFLTELIDTGKSVVTKSRKVDLVVDKLQYRYVPEIVGKDGLSLVYEESSGRAYYIDSNGYRRNEIPISKILVMYSVGGKLNN